MRVMAATLVAGVLVAACASPDPGGAEDRADDVGTIEVTSAAFEEGATIPTRFTCDGADVSPPLSWSGVPVDAVELVVVVEDPDAPRGTFVHWIVAGIDPMLDRLATGEVPDGAVEGVNDFGEAGHRGPCPPVGDDPHRYRFVVHALGAASELRDRATADEVREAVAGHTIATGELTADYGRAD